MNTNTFDAAALSLQHGQEYPYDLPDDGQAAPARDWAHKAARGILCDLTDRCGIKHGFSGVDEDVRAEIVQSLAEIIRRATPPSPSTAEVDERYSPSILDADGLPEVIAGVLRSDGDAVALAALYALLNRWGSEQRQHARRAAMRVVELASRPAVEAGELPPLPETDVHTGDEDFGDNVSSFSPAAMRDYGQACARAALATKSATSAPGAAGGDRAALAASFRAGIQQTRATLCGEPGAGASAQKEE